MTDVNFKFTAETGDLEAQMAETAAHTRALQQEMRQVANEMEKAGASADASLGQKLRELGKELAEAKKQSADFAAQLHDQKQGAEQAGNGFTGLKDDLATLKEGVAEVEGTFLRLAAVAGVAFTASAFKDWVKSTTEAAYKIRQDSATLGTSPEEVQQLKGIAEMSGVDYGGLRDKIESMRLTLAKSADATNTTTAALKALGIEVNQFKGQSIAEQMKMAADAAAKFADGATKGEAIGALFGKDMIPFLDRGRQGIEDMNSAIERSSYVMSGGMVNAIATTRDHVDQLALAWSGLSRIYAVINPAVDAVIREMVDLINSIKTDDIAAGAATLSGRLIDMAAKISEFALRAKSDWEGLVNAITSHASDIAGAAQTADAWLTKAKNFGHEPPEYARDMQTMYTQWAERMDLISKATGDKWIAAINATYNAAKGGQDAFGGLDTAGLQLQFTLQGIEDHAKKAKEALAGLLAPSRDPRGEQNLSGPAAPEGAFGPFKPQVPAMDTSDATSGADHAAKDAETELRAAVLNAHNAFDAIKQDLADALADHKTGMAEWAKDTTAALDHEADAVQDSYAEILANAKVASERKKLLAAEENDKLMSIWKEESDAHRKMVDEMQRQYEGYASTVTGAFASQLRGLLAGTESFHTAFKSVLADLTMKFIESSIAMTGKWVADEAVKVAASQAGATAIAASNTAAEAAGIAGLLASLGRTIAADAGAAFGGVFAFLAPFLGPAAAGPAAGAEATVMAHGIGMMDIGAWNIPHDQLAMVHKNELIMPAAESQAFRSMLSSGGAGDAGARVSVSPQANFHIHSMDSASVAKTLRDNSGAVMKAIEHAVRHGAHLGLRGIR